MKRILPILFVLVLGGFFVGGCETTTTKKSTGKSNPPSKLMGGVSSVIETRSNALASTNSLLKGNSEALARFAAGESYRLNEHPELAETQYLASVQADPGNEELAIELAREYLKDQLPKKAVALLTKPAARPNASSRVIIWLARSCWISGNTNEALAACHRALQKPVESLEGYEFLIETLTRGGEQQEALRTLTRLGKNAKKDSEYLVSLAELYAIYGILSTEGKSAVDGQAVALLDRAANLAPTSPDLQKRMADEYARFGQTQKSALYYTKVLAGLTRSSVLRDSIREKLANIYLQAGDKTNAVKQLQSMVHDNPTGFPEAWYLLGTLAYEEMQMEEAARDFEQAILLEPNLEQAYYDLALVQIDLKNPDKAEKILAKAATRFPKSFVSEFFNAMADARRKRYGEAVKHFTAAEIIARINDSRRLNKEFYFQYGAACERNHDFKQAAELFQKCLVLDENFAEALNYLGFMWAERGENLPKAKEMIERAVKLDPKNGAYLDSLGWAYYQLKQPTQALTWLLKAQEFTPEPDPTLFDHLGDIYFALHQNDKARGAWEKSLSLEANPEVKKKLDQVGGGHS